jgi:hypothetical protein
LRDECFAITTAQVTHPCVHPPAYDCSLRGLRCGPACSGGGAGTTVSVLRRYEIAWRGSAASWPVVAQARTDLRWHPMLGQPAQALSAPWRRGRAADAELRKRGPAEGALTIGNRANGHACPHLHGFHPLDVDRWAWTPARHGVNTVQSGPSWGLKTDRGTCCVWVGAAQVRHMGLLSCKVQVIDHTQRSHKHVGWPGQKCCPGDLVWAQTWQFACSPQCVHGHGVHLGMLPTQNSGPQPPLPDHTPQA